MFYSPHSGDASARAEFFVRDSWNRPLAARRLRGIPTTEAGVMEAIGRQADMGVDEFILRPCAEELDQLERLAELAARVR